MARVLARFDSAATARRRARSLLGTNKGKARAGPSRLPSMLPPPAKKTMPSPTPRPEPGLVRRTARVLVLPAPTAGGGGSDRVRFALRLGTDGWVEVAESLLTEDSPAGGAEATDAAGGDPGEPAAARESAPAQSWPMLLRGLAEAEAVVNAHHARRQRGESGSGPPPSSPRNRARPERL